MHFGLFGDQIGASLREVEALFPCRATISWHQAMHGLRQSQAQPELAVRCKKE